MLLPRAYLASVRRRVACALAACLVPAACTTAPECGPAADVERVADGLYVRPGRLGLVFEDEHIANVGFVVGERCVAVLDTGGSLEEGEALACAIRRTTPLPVCYVINTHVHPDHLLGNRAFAGPAVEFIGHAKLPRAIGLRGNHYLGRAAAIAGRPFDRDLLVPPGRTVSDRLEIDLGGRRLLLTAHVSAHTDHDLSIYDAETGTLWLGDLLFLEHVPVIDGSVNGWLRVLESLAALPAERVVPGHGPVRAWPQALQDTRRYLTVVRDETRAFIAAGGGLRDAQDRVGYAEAEAWRLFESFHKRNVATAFAELEWE